MPAAPPEGATRAGLTLGGGDPGFTKAAGRATRGEHTESRMHVDDAILDEWAEPGAGPPDDPSPPAAAGEIAVILTFVGRQPERPPAEPAQRAA